MSGPSMWRGDDSRRDGLHQAVALHRFVDVHRVAAGSVKARQPHVADDQDFQWIVGVFESFFEVFLVSRGEDVPLDVSGVGGRTGHDDADGTVFVVVADLFAFVVLGLRSSPVRMQLDDLGKKNL
jgi:hypothetical protein